VSIWKITGSKRYLKNWQKIGIKMFEIGEQDPHSKRSGFEYWSNGKNIGWQRR
jgi:hypothetical protein